MSLGVVAGETGNIDRARVSTQYLPVNYAGADIEFVRPVWLGDRVIATEAVGEDRLVEVQMQNRNQAGLATALGTATVKLPSVG